MGVLHVTWQDCYLLCMNCTQVHVLKQAHEIGLCSFLQCSHSNSLESDLWLLVLHNLLNESLEWQFLKVEFSCLLIPIELPKNHGAGSKLPWLERSLHARCSFASTWTWGLSAQPGASPPLFAWLCMPAFLVSRSSSAWSAQIIGPWLRRSPGGSPD